MTDDAPPPLERSAFRYLPDAEQAALASRFARCRYRFGDVIVRQGDEADAYYLLTEGRARVVRTTERGQEITLGVLRPGDDFGEAALSEGGTRSATVRCSGAVEALRLGRVEFIALVAERPAVRRAVERSGRSKAVHRFLHEYTTFGRLPPACLERLIGGFEARTFARGEKIVRQGDPPGPMFVVERGRVRVFATIEGKTRNLAFLREGEHFGEMSALNAAPRAATVEASVDCRLLALPPELVLALRAEFPEMRTLLEERIAQYASDRVARVPLDFAVELLPADASRADKVAMPDAEPAADAPPPAPTDETALPAPARRRRIGRFPFIAQIDEMDCAAASLAMVARHLGRDAPLARVRELCHTSVDGTSLRAICSAATELGLSARAAKVSPGNLDEMPTPAILHWEGNHWVVLVDVDGAHVRIADPSTGVRRVPRSELAERWTGYAALFDHVTTVERAAGRRSALAWTFPFFAHHRRALVQVLLLAGVVAVIQLLLPVFTQTVIDSVIVDRDLGLLRTVVLGMAASLVFLLVAGVTQQYLLAFTAVRIDAALLDYLTRRLLALPLRYFQTRRTGDIQRRLDGVQEVRELVVQHGIGGLLAAVVLTGTVALMLAYSVPLALTFLAVLPAYAALVHLSIRRLRPILSDLEASRGRYRAHQIDAIKGIEAVKAAAAEGAFRDAMLAQFLGVSRQQFRGTFFFLAYDAAVQALTVVSSALILWIGAHRVTAGELSVGTFVAFNALAWTADAAIVRLLTTWERVLSASVLLDRLDDVLSQEPEQGEASGLVPVPSLEGHVELRDVGFRYGGPESPRILDGISLEIPAGTTLALVGRSGCGKTTLAKLLSGLLEPTEGAILFDRMDVATLHHGDLRRRIGIVLQENHVFDGTIRDNIAFGDSTPDVERVHRAARLANAHEFVMRLPLAYETRIGESGMALSGGQRQRVAIARALYGDPPVLIFDEATSALDSESERAIQDNMAQLLAGRTSIVIAHRLSTIRDADRIVVLEKGRVAETGTHDELMALRGLYFYLSSQQAPV